MATQRNIKRIIEVENNSEFKQKSKNALECMKDAAKNSPTIAVCQALFEVDNINKRKLQLLVLDINFQECMIQNVFYSSNGDTGYYDMPYIYGEVFDNIFEEVMSRCGDVLELHGDL